MLKWQLKFMPCANRRLLCHGLDQNGYVSIICLIFKESENSDTFQEFDGLPTTRMIIPFSNHKTSLAKKISITTFNQCCLIISTVKKIVLFNQY